jgi:uncharacterized protein (TIGR02996 family)
LLAGAQLVIAAPMPEIAALQAHLRRHPEDWESWLVYADWLTDQGDDHGQLIRLDHRLTFPVGEVEYSRLWRERTALVRAHGWESDGTLRLKNGRLDWRHGFLWGAQLGDQIVTETLRLLLKQPHLQMWVSLTLDRPRARELADLAAMLPRLPIDTLTVCGGPGNEKLLGRLLGKLVELHLVDTRIEDGGVEHLLLCEGIGALYALELVGCGLTDAAAARLAHTPQLPALTHLSLQNNGLGPESAESLARRPLRSLDLSHNHLVDRGATALARADALSGLVSLDLSHNGIGMEGIEALAHSQSLRSLRSLSLAGNPLTDDEIEALATSEALGSLVSLDLSDTQLEEWALLALARSETLQKLTSLRIVNVPLSPESAHQLAELRPELSLEWYLEEDFEEDFEPFDEELE